MDVVAVEECDVVADVVAEVVAVVVSDDVAVVVTEIDCVDDCDVVGEVVTEVVSVLEIDEVAVEVGVDDAVFETDVDIVEDAVEVAVVRHFSRGMYESASLRAALFRCSALSSSSVHCSFGGCSLAMDDSTWYCPGNGTSASTTLYTSRVASANGDVPMRRSSSLFELRDLASVIIMIINGTAPYRYPCAGRCRGAK